MATAPALETGGKTAPAPRRKQAQVASRKVSVPYSDEVFEEIIGRLAAGELYAEIERSDPERYPTLMSVYSWMNARSELKVAYGQAREVGADNVAMECISIADDSSNDAYVAYRDDGTPYAKLDNDCIKRAALRIDTRLKILAKWHPHKYGDKVLHAGHDGGALDIKHRFDVVALADKARALARRNEPGAQLIEHQPVDGEDLV